MGISLLRFWVVGSGSAVVARSVVSWYREIEGGEIGAGEAEDDTRVTAGALRNELVSPF